MAEPQAAPADPVADVLRSVPVPNDVRAKAWNLYDGAANADDLAAGLKDLPLAQTVKAQLWRMKEAATQQPSDISLTIGGPVAPPILTPTGPAGFSNLSDTPDQPATVRAKLFDALDRNAMPRSGMDLAALLMQGDAGETVMNRVVAPVAAGVSRYGGAATDLLSSLLPAKVKAPLAILRELNPWSWNSPFTVAGREARDVAASGEAVIARADALAAHASKVVDRFMPNIGGVPDAGIPQGPLPQVPPSPVDRFMPNRGSVPDAGVPQGPLPQVPSSPVDRFMPNRSGVPDAGVPQGPLPQSGFDRYLPNRSGVGPSAPVPDIITNGIIPPPASAAVPPPAASAVISPGLQAAMQRTVAKIGTDETRALLTALQKGVPDLTPAEIQHSLALAEQGLSRAKILAAVKALRRTFSIASVLPK